MSMGDFGVRVRESTEYRDPSKFQFARVYVCVCVCACVDMDGQTPKQQQP